MRDHRRRGRRRLCQRSPACAACAISASCCPARAARSRATWPTGSRPWIEDGEHAWLFDNEVDRLDLSTRVLGFDMTALLENPRLRTPVMMYLFHRIDERLDGAADDDPDRRGLEGARRRGVRRAHPRLAQDAAQAQRAGRLRHADRARDALDSRISTALVEQTATMIFMPNATRPGGGLLRRLRPDRARAGADPHACRRTAAASSSASPMPSVVVRLDLSGAPEVLTILSGRESAVRRLDLLREAVGDDPAQWYPALTGRAWPGAASTDEDDGFELGRPPNERRCLPVHARHGRRRRRHRRSAARRRLRRERDGAGGLQPPVRRRRAAWPRADDPADALGRLSRLRADHRAHRLGLSSLTPRMVTLGLV